MKLADTCDIIVPETQQASASPGEEPVWIQYLRLLVNKHPLPTTLKLVRIEEEKAKLPGFVK